MSDLLPAIGIAIALIIAFAIGIVAVFMAQQKNAIATVPTGAVTVPQQKRPQTLIEAERLVAVPPGHWLISVLCNERVQFSRSVALFMAEELADADSMLPTEQLTTSYLTEYLSDLKHEHLKDTDARSMQSWGVLWLACVFSELLPEYEPLLVEVAVVHCVHEWSRGDRGGSSLGDANAFEAFLKAELQGEGAREWFNCQFVMGTLDLLRYSCYFYKQRIPNPALRDLISMSIMDSYGASNDVNVQQAIQTWRTQYPNTTGYPRQNLDFEAALKTRLAMPSNKAASDAWTAWLGEEIATVGSTPRSQNEPTSLMCLSEFVINPTQFHPDKRAYFPFSTTLANIGANVFRDLGGVISRKTESDDAQDTMAWGFMYRGGELLKKTTQREVNVDSEEMEDAAHPHDH